MKVLLADDSGLILERLQGALSPFKHIEIVGSFKNGIETLEGLRSLKPQMAIVDIKMPGLSGLEVLSEIRKENKDVKFIILTFYASEYHRQLAMQSGADYFFSKVDDFDKAIQVAINLVYEEEH